MLMKRKIFEFIVVVIVMLLLLVKNILNENLKVVKLDITMFRVLRDIVSPIRGNGLVIRQVKRNPRIRTILRHRLHHHENIIKYGEEINGKVNILILVRGNVIQITYKKVILVEN